MRLISTTFLLAILLFSSFSTAETATATVDPSGTWRWDLDNDGENVKNELKVHINDKKEVVAVYSGLLDRLESTSGSIHGNKLVLKFDHTSDDGTTYDIKYDSEIDGDDVAGTIYIKTDDGTQEYEWKAKRSVKLSDVVGEWKIEMETPEGEIHDHEMVVKKEGDDYQATYRADGLGECTVSDLKAENTTFSCTVKGSLEGDPFEAHVHTFPKGNTLRGKVELKLNGEAMELELAGARESAG